MGKWKAVSSRRVDERFLRLLLTTEGSSWESVAHVTATASLARSVRKTRTVGLPIATLTDLVIQPGMPDAPLTLDAFPGPDVLGRAGVSGYDLAMSEWQHLASGRRFRRGIRFDDELRRFARFNVTDPSQRSLLVKARREFARTIHTLIAAGIKPSDLVVDSEIGHAALAAWEWLENELPALSAPRNDLWIDLHEFQTQSTPRSKSLRNRIEAALEHVYGISQGRRVIVYHGFYFFTPPQWAVFQLLRRIPNVDQIFIVHDDGSNPAFETWRRFFTGNWSMPVPQNVDSILTSDVDTSFSAKALLQALSGDTVTSSGTFQDVAVVECRSPIELVRHWQDEGDPAAEDLPRRFAADSSAVERFVRRLGRDEHSGPVDLAQLPIGSFLLAIHECIKPAPGGGVEVVLTDEAVLEIADSGYLDDSGPTDAAMPSTSALRRALSFFKGCRTGEQWRNRARDLHGLVLSEVSPLGRKVTGATDLQRIALAADNPLRLAPWADLSVDEAVHIRLTIEKIVKLVTEMASQERVALSEHMHFLQKKLARGMQGLPDDERREIETKIQGFSVGLEEEVDVEGLVDIVAMLLGRTASFDLTDDVDMTTNHVGDLGGLDSLGMNKLPHDLHVANLADKNFPSRVVSVGWPFRLEDMTSPGASVNPVAAELIAARAESAALSDLYLLWLALDGVQVGNRVTLSWISELNGEKHNLSPLVSLLTRPQRGTDAVKTRAGGVELNLAGGTSLAASAVARPSAAPLALPIAFAISATAKIDPRAGASAAACPRRFALQWVLGTSHAYQSEHHHALLYGNIIEALVKLKGMAATDALRAATDLWRNLTPGQRRSSIAMRRVHPHRNSANGLWTLTLAGRMTGTKPVDRAYRAAVEGTIQELEAFVPSDSDLLPPGINDPSTCVHCPVRRSCTVSG